MNLHDELKAFEEKIKGEAEAYIIALADEDKTHVVMRVREDDFADIEATMFIKLAEHYTKKDPENVTMDKALDAIFQRVRSKVKTRMMEEEA